MGRREDRTRWLALLAATAVAIYLCWLMVRPLIGVLAWAAVLVIIFYPVHQRINARLRSPGLSALVSCLLVVCVVLVPLLLLTLALVRELSGVAQSAQQIVTVFLDPNQPLTGRLFGWLERYFDLEQLRSLDYLKQRLAGMGGAIASSTLGLVGGVAGAVVDIFFIIFTMYYLFRDGERIAHRLPDVLPLEREQGELIIARTKDVIGASVYGVLVIAVIQGTLGGLAFWALGVPSAFVWGMVMILLSMIPMAGAFLVWVPAALYLLATGHWVKAMLLVVWGVFVIGMIDNFLRPKLVGERTKLHELLIFFSVVGGLQVFGVLGLVLGPVVLAVALALFDVMRRADPSSPALPSEPTVAEATASQSEEP